MISSIIFKISVFAVIFSLIIPIGSSYSEELETVQLEIKYTNGDRRDATKVNYVVYQDFDSTPFLEKKLDTNPEEISLPQDHRYKVEVYVDGLYSESGYVNLKNSPEELDISIPLPGGIQFNVFFERGEKPMPNVIFKLKTIYGKEISTSNTDQHGNTLRYWLQPTLRGETYVAEIYVGQFLAASVPNIKVFTGISQDQKITVPIPEIVEDLLTFRLFDTESKKVLKDDGDFSIVLADQNFRPLHTSSMKDKGEIYFSNIPSGVYYVLVLNDGKRENTWDNVPIAIFGNQDRFDLFENAQMKPIKEPISVPIKEPISVPIKEPISVPIKEPISVPIKEPIFDPIIYEPSVKEYTLSCNCVAIRFDDVQDFWLTDVQLEMIDVFSKDNIPLTIGVLSSTLQFDEKLVDVVKNGIKNNNIEIANHGIDHTPLTEFNKAELDERLKESQKQFKEVFNVTPKVFIPPNNIFTEDTKQVLIENGFTHFSSSNIYEAPPYSLQNEELFSFPRVASTGTYDLSQKIFVGSTADTIFPILLDSLDENGFAVVAIHPQEYSIFKNGEPQNKPNSKQIQELGKLIELIKTENIELVYVSQIDQKVSKVVVSSPSTNGSDEQIIPTWLKNNAGWWRDGHIDNDTFVQGIQFLINEGIVELPPTSQGSGGSEIPNWVKNNAGWWAEGQISDNDFIQGINHLVNLGVIIIGI